MDSHRDPDSHPDPNLSDEELAHERWVLSLLREVEREVRAPRRLRRRIEAARAPTRPRGLRAATAMTAAAAVLGVAVLLPGGPATPSLTQAAGLASRGAASPAPTPDPDDPDVKLSEQVGNAYFPNWTSTLGWRPTGLRHDVLDMHRAVTVYYSLGAARLAYTILSAPALPQPAARVTVESGVTVRTLRLHGRLAVTWRREGSTCILTGTNVSGPQLRRLALTDPRPDPD
jgi:hypothetical protein